MKSAAPKIAAGAGAVAVAAVVAVMLLMPGTYRNVLIEAFTGISQITREGSQSLEPYAGMQLKGGDDIRVPSSADMTLSADGDKHLYAEPETHFWLEASGGQGSTETIIYMDEGATLHELDNKLGDSETYQVDTPSATMSVRGTVFRVQIYDGSDGFTYTLVEVFEGQVDIALKDLNGKPNGVSASFKAGEAALIRANSELTEFVLTDEVDGLVWENAENDPIKVEGSPGKGVEQHTIPYKKLPKATARVLVSWMRAGREMCISPELLEDYTGLADHVRVVDKAVEGDCTTDSLTEGSHCEVCGEVLVEQKRIAAPGHDWVYVETRPATDSKPAQRVYRCSRCGEERTEDVTDTPAARTSAPGSTPGAPQAGRTAQPIQAPQPTPVTQPADQATQPSENQPDQQEQAPAAQSDDSGEWVLVSHKDATCTKAGSEVYRNSMTGVTRTETIAKLGHSWKLSKTVKATCTKAGKKVYTCKTCGKKKNKSIAKLGHSYQSVTFSWSDDHSSCKATRSCKRGDAEETVNATVTSKVTKQATCTDKGTTQYTASATIGGKAYTDTKTATDIEALGHSWGAVQYQWDTSGDTPTCKAWRTCSRDASHEDPDAETVTATHDSAGSVAATCTEAGKTHWVATFAKTGHAAQSHDETIAATGHSVHEIAAQAATCVAAGWKAHYQCDTCGKYFSDRAATSELAAGSDGTAKTNASMAVAKLSHEYAAQDDTTADYYYDSSATWQDVGTSVPDGLAELMREHWTDTSAGYEFQATTVEARRMCAHAAADSALAAKHTEGLYSDYAVTVYKVVLVSEKPDPDDPTAGSVTFYAVATSGGCQEVSDSQVKAMP